MNRRLRVLLIGRHFWPHGSIDSAGYLIQLANGLQRHGLHVEVLTPRYASSWTNEFTYREIKVHRVASAPRGDWSMGRYARHLTTWLRENASSFDVLFADSAREEAIAAVEASRAIGCRSMVRVSGWGEHCDIDWWSGSRSAKRCAGFTKTADRVIAVSASGHRRLVQAGFDASRISRVDVGFATGANRTETLRQRSRKALGRANGDLHVDEDEMVMVCVGKMVREGGMQLLSKSARHLIARYKNLRLWFIGDGANRESMFEFLRGEGVRASIAMPGSFADIDDVLAAADIFIQPDESGLDFLLPAAISAEVPIVVLDNESTREVLRETTGEMAGSQLAPDSSGNQDSSGDKGSPGDMVQWFQGATSSSLRKAIRNTMDDMTQSRQNAAALRRFVLRTRPLDQAIQQYAGLIQQTVSQSALHRNDTSIEAAS